jgi:hypothetical protein
MKKITLLVASILLVGSVAKATVIKITDVSTTTRFSFEEPISFTERGIEFFVFANGDFDFNTRPNDSQGDYHYKLAGKRTSDVNRVAENYGVLIEHDSYGRVRRVGNTFINYDNRDRVNRIGTVYMKYNRFGLIQIGGMQIMYNRRGEIVNRIGQVKGYRNYGYAYQTYQNQYETDDYYNTSYHATNNNSNAYYYYKADGTKEMVDDKKEEQKEEQKEN